MASPVPDLRPRGVGELLDLTFRLYRRNFLRLTGITLVVLGPLAALNILANSGSLSAYLDALRNALNETGSSTSPATGLLSLASACAGAIALLVGIFYSWMDGALIYCVIESILGRAPTWRESYRATRPRWGALWLGIAIRTVALAVLLVPLVAALYFALFAGLIGAGALSTSPTGGNDTGLLLVGLLAFCLPLSLAWGAVAVYVLVSWSMIEPAIVGEGISAGASLGRSNTLASGYRLRLTGRLLIFEVMRFIVVGLPLLAVQVFFFAGTAMSAATAADTSPLGILVLVLATVIGSLAEIIVAPLYMIYITLNYLDLRVRKENLDLQLKAAQLVTRAPEAAPALVPATSAAALTATGAAAALPAADQAPPQTVAYPSVSPAQPLDQSPVQPPARPPASSPAAQPAEGGNPAVTPEPAVDLSTLTPAQRASVLFRRLRTEGPSAELLNELGLAYQQIGDTYGALDAFTRARTLAPDEAAIAYNMALLQRDRRDYVAARRAMADYLRLEKDPEERQRAMDNPSLKDILP